MNHTQRRLPKKPTLRLDPQTRGWQCHDDYYIWGIGSTPYLAYVDWKIKEQKRTRISRRGWWNIRSCRQWFNEGCWTLRSYIGHQQIFGYDPCTDELILRG